jgi:NADPH2:quinone reductase
VLGLEGSGVVEEVGAGVSGIAKGQRVTFLGPGAYAEKVAVDASGIIPLPDEVDFDSGAAYPVVYLTAYHVLHTLGGIRQGGWVVLFAPLGGVGTAVLQLAKIAGVHVIGLTSSEDKAARARSLGFDHVLTYDRENLVEEIVRITGGKGADLVLDSVGGPRFARDFDMLAALGQVVWFGFAGGMPGGDLLDAIAKNFVRGVGLRTFHLVFSVAEPHPEVFGPSVGTILAYLRERKIAPVIADRLPLKDAARAHQLLESRNTVGKLLLVP